MKKSNCSAVFTQSSVEDNLRLRGFSFILHSVISWKNSCYFLNQTECKAVVSWRMFMYTQTCIWVLLFWSVLLKILIVLLALHSSTEISKWGLSYLLNRWFTCSCLGVNSRRIFSVSIFLSLRSLFSGEYAQTFPTFKLSIGPKKQSTNIWL